MVPARYGCRIIQRLLENCDAEQLASVLDPIVASAGKLSKESSSPGHVYHDTRVLMPARGLDPAGQPCELCDSEA